VPWFWQTVSDAPYYYDESDYVYAGTRGLMANFLDRPSLSLVEFVQHGLALSRGQSKSADMSRLVREMGDISFYRHYHGPMYAYWLALCQLAGADKETDYRGSGLLLHSLTALAVLGVFRWALPALPVWSGLLAALAYLLNRTGLVAASLVTQHVLFPLWTALALFLLGRFRRDLERRYLYLAAVVLGLAFATLESSFILLGAAVLCVVSLYPRLRIGEMWNLTWRGALVFLATTLVVWPKGVLELGLLKGYVYLAYIAIFKRTFTPISPFTLWMHKFVEYPYEFVLPAAALVAGVVFYRKLRCREEIAPFLIYGWLFVGVTMVVTAPFTYYHTSLLLTGAVVVGMLAGELYLWKPGIGTVASAAAVASLVAMAWIYHQEAAAEKQSFYESRAEAIRYVRAAGPKSMYYVPFEAVPPLHFYAPEIEAVAVEKTWTPPMLAALLTTTGDKPKQLLCPESQCDQVERALSLPPGRVHRIPVAKPAKDLLEPLFSLSIETESAQ
jgi:hypothetical protein